MGPGHGGRQVRLGRSTSAARAAKLLALDSLARDS